MKSLKGNKFDMKTDIKSLSLSLSLSLSKSQNHGLDKNYMRVAFVKIMNLSFKQKIKISCLIWKSTRVLVQ